MRFTTIFKTLGLALMAVVFAGQVFAADVSNTLTAGVWKSTTKLVGDVNQVVQMTRLTNGVSTTARLQMPTNAITSPRILLTGTNTSAGGISSTLYLYPTPDSFKITSAAGRVSYTDLVSLTTQLADVNSASPSLVVTQTGAYSGLVLTGGASLGTNEVLDVRIIYDTPVACRWPKC